MGQTQQLASRSQCCGDFPMVFFHFNQMVKFLYLSSKCCILPPNTSQFSIDCSWESKWSSIHSFTLQLLQSVYVCLSLCQGHRQQLGPPCPSDQEPHCSPPGLHILPLPACLSDLGDDSNLLCKVLINFPTESVISVANVQCSLVIFRHADYMCHLAV